MRKFWKKVLTVTIAATMAVSMVACGQNTSSNETSTEATGQVPDKITLGYWESPNGELLAKENGKLEEAFPDTNIEWVEFQSGTDILTAIQSGSIDFATIGTPPATLGIANNYPFKIFYLHDVIGESEGLIVKNESGIQSVEDLKGKTIATTFGTTSHFAFQNILKSKGLAETDINLLDMTGPDIYAAWQRGDIDGAYIWESVKSQLIAADGTEIVSSADAAEVGGLTAEVGIVYNGFYEQYPDVVKTYIDILDESVEEYKSNQEESAKKMAAGLGLSEEETLTAMNEIIVKNKAEQKEYLGTSGQLQTTLKDTADFLKEQGSIDTEVKEETIQAAILSELYE